MLVKPSPNGAPVEITAVSRLVASIAPERVLRFYVPREEDRAALGRLWDQLQKETGGRFSAPAQPSSAPRPPHTTTYLKTLPTNAATA